jgi:outer membrane protein assembly factor BamE (lipoprotein component of BamABCDE complex)
MTKRILRLLAFALVAALPAAAFAQAVAGATRSIAQAERNAVDLRQGMTLEEVQQLLGKPRRTALVANGVYAGTSGQGTLQWTYVWSGAAPSSPAERSLQIDFAARAADQWTVNGWNWSLY